MTTRWYSDKAREQIAYAKPWNIALLSRIAESAVFSIAFRHTSTTFAAFDKVDTKYDVTETSEIINDIDIPSRLKFRRLIVLCEYEKE